jgi:isocitrate lyase
MWTSRWKVTVPHEDFIDKLMLLDTFLETRYRRRNYCCEQILKAGLTQNYQLVSGDLASKYLAFVEADEIAT